MTYKQNKEKMTGQIIRDERRLRNMTLEQLAEETGLSKGFLSQIERSQAQPSVATLKKIAQVFGMSIIDLFVEEHALMNTDLLEENRKQEEDYITDVTLVPADKRKKFILPGSHIVYEMMTSDLNRKMQILYLKFSPGDSLGEKIQDPKGEKCLILLKGAIEYTLGEDVHVMREGDCIYFPASLKQSWKGIGDVDIEALVIMTPPWF